MNKYFSITRDKRHTIYRFCGIRFSKKHSFNRKLYKNFIKKEVKPHTVLLIEYNNCHFETLLGLCKHCTDLNYNVDIITRYNAEKIFENLNLPNVRTFECNEDTFKNLFSKYDFSKYERLIYNSKIIYGKQKDSTNNEYDLSEIFVNIPKGQKENIYLQHHIDIMIIQMIYKLFLLILQSKQIWINSLLIVIILKILRLRKIKMTSQTLFQLENYQRKEEILLY